MDCTSCRWRRALWAAVAGWALALALGASGCASGRASLPEFPKYEPADDFLAMQARAQAHQPPAAPTEYVYTQRNQEIYDALQRQKRQSDAEVAYRARQSEAAQRRHRAANQGEWDALQQRLARDEALGALRDQELSANQQRYQSLNSERYQTYQERLERLAREQEATVREQERFAYRNQQRVQAQLEEFRRRQSQNQFVPVPGPASAGASQP